MKEYLRKITALSLASTLFAAGVSCGKEKPEEINDSQEQSESEVYEKPVLDVAMLSTVSDTFMAKMNNHNSELCTLNYRNYADEAFSAPVSDDPMQDARDTLHRDMISGNCPDIIMADMNFMLPLIDSGYFADLYQFMSEETVTREAFLPNVLSGFERDGKLPVLAPGIRFSTVAAKSEHLGKEYENWSLDEAIAYMESMPEDVQVLHIQHKIHDLPNFMLTKTIRDSIDLENSTCDFQGAFLDIFEFVERKNISENVDYESMTGDYFVNEENNLINDKALLTEVFVAGINSIITQELYRPFRGADVTFVGYPSNDGCGTVMSSDSMEFFGILENSDCKDGAWEFVSSLFTVSYQTLNTVSFGGVPVIEEAIDKAMEYTDMNSLSINFPIEKSTEGEILCQIDENTKQLFGEYLRRVEFQPYYDTTLDMIAREEYLPVINGETDAQSAADMIDNRISLYLNEKS